MSAGAGPFGFTPPSMSPGSEAAVVLFDPDAEWEAGADGWESRSENSCFAGRRLRGRVLMTVVAGRVAYRQRTFAMGVAA
jgi:dihydroorotase